MGGGGTYQKFVLTILVLHFQVESNYEEDC